MSIQDGSTHSLQIVSGSTTTTFQYPNKFTLQLPAYGLTTGIDEVSLKSLTMYYSWPNISLLKGNNSFSYMLSGVSYPVVMGDGIYSFADINNFLTQVMVLNGHYMIDSNGNKKVFMTFIVNPALYCLSLDIFPVPSILPDGWTNPMSMPLGSTLQLSIPLGMSALTGFAAGLYPPTPWTVLYQINSGIPQISDVTSLNVTSNVVDASSFSLSTNVMASLVVAIGQQPGSQIQFQPVNLDWVGLQKRQTFTEITLEIKDQLLRPVIMRDPSGFVAIMNIRRRKQ